MKCLTAMGGVSFTPPAQCNIRENAISNTADVYECNGSSSCVYRAVCITSEFDSDINFPPGLVE